MVVVDDVVVVVTSVVVVVVVGWVVVVVGSVVVVVVSSVVVVVVHFFGLHLEAAAGSDASSNATSVRMNMVRFTSGLPPRRFRHLHHRCLEVVHELAWPVDLDLLSSISDRR